MSPAGVTARLDCDDGPDDLWRELRHEAHAALLGIEAASIGLAEHQHLMSPDEVAHLSSALVAEVHRLHRLLDSSLADGVEEPERFAVAAAIGPVVACVRATGLPVTLDVPDGLRVEGVSTHTAQVVRSLLDNVSRHAPGSEVQIRADIERDHVSITVSDTGPGIAAALRRVIFDRGARGERSPGSGLGLYIARRLMDEQGGAIWIDSAPGSGTTVHLRLRRPPVTERLYAVV